MARATTKGDETRASVLNKALDLASRVGLSGVTVGRLAEQAGMSKSGLFAHFSSREALEIEILKAASDRFVAEVVSPALKARRGEPRVAALFRRWLTWKDVLPGGCIFVAAAAELDDRPGPVRDALVSTQRDLLDTLATAARIAVQEGHFRSDLDPAQFAYETYCLGQGYHAVSRLLRDADADDRAHTAFERLLRDSRCAG